jgi:transposase
VLDGPINGQLFTAYVERFLVPTLSPGDIVIMDNLGSHKGQAVRRAIRGCGTRLLFLPPYSPEFNPIEQVFAKLKTLLRTAEERSVEAMETHRFAARRFQPCRMRTLPQKRRLCFKLR